MSGNGEQIDLNSESYGINLSHPATDSLNEQRNVESRAWELGNKAADVEFLEGSSIDNAKVTEIDSATRKGEESSMALNDLSDVEMESSQRNHTPVKVECKVEINADNNAEGGGVADNMTGDHSIIESQEEGVGTMQHEDEKVTQIEEMAFDSVVDVKCDQGVKEDSESHSLLDHEGCVDVHISINPDDSFHYKDVDDSSSLHDNLGSASPKNAEDTIQLTVSLDKKSEILMGSSNELPHVLATDIRTLPLAVCSKNQSGNVDDGQTIENSATGSNILKTGALTDLDKSNLFDVVVEVDPYVKMDEDHISDDVNEDSVVGFNVSELVWSRVPSHPWWPGQICDPAASTKKAMKYFKTGRYLVAFFGDHTFAWKEAVMIKPFQEYFSELQKQNNLESFHRAIDCALEEFSRRVEFSLACTCLSEELYSQLQTQTLTNAGIRKKLSKRVGGDSSLTASSFDPMKLINIVKEVAMSPSCEADKLELVRARAQLMAFNRWKGYYELPKYDKHSVVFNVTDQILDVKNDDQSLIQKKNDDQSASMVDIAIDIKHDEAAISGKGSMETQHSSGGERKRKSVVLKDSSKKGKSLSNLIPKKPRRSWKKKQESQENAGNELNLLVSSTKDEVVSCNNTATITHVESGKTTPSFKVGDRIRKVACKLNESNPILKPDDGLSQAAASKTKRGRKRNKETSELVSGMKTGNKSTKTRKRRNVSAPVEASDSEFIKDTYWTDRLIQGIAEDQVTSENQNETVEGHVQTPSATVIPNELVEPESENCVEDPYPTALIITFTDLDSIPSETNLNDIFGKYGPLYESKTEVMKKSRGAKVVFKRTSDAETAFSSTGKDSIFGTALVSYRLKFLPPTKVLSRGTRRGRKKRNLKNQPLLLAA